MKHKRQPSFVTCRSVIIASKLYKLLSAGVLLSERHFLRRPNVFATTVTLPILSVRKLIIIIIIFIYIYIYFRLPCALVSIVLHILFTSPRAICRRRCVFQETTKPCIVQVRITWWLTVFGVVGVNGIIVTAHKPNNFSNLISLVANIKENKNSFTIIQNCSALLRFFSFNKCNAHEYYVHSKT